MYQRITKAGKKNHRMDMRVDTKIKGNIKYNKITPVAYVTQMMDEEQNNARRGTEATEQIADKISAEVMTKIKTKQHGNPIGIAAELTMRAATISAMNYLNASESPYEYNWDDDSLTLPEYWEEVRHTSVDDGDDGRGSAFVKKPGVNPSMAITRTIEGPHPEGTKYFLECSTAVLLAHYYGICKAYEKIKTINGDLEGNPFDWEEGSNMVIAPDLVTEIIQEKGKYKIKNNINNTVQINNLEDLIPGDCVYFQNYSDYPQTHDGAEAAWEGEWAIYAGDNKYIGFGVGEVTYDEMVGKLIKNYNDQGTKDGKKHARTEPEPSNATVTNKLPGLIKEVKRPKTISIEYT